MKSIKTSENFSFWGRPLRKNALQNTLQGIFSKKWPKKCPKNVKNGPYKVVRR